MTLLPDELKDGCQLVAAERFGQARARTQIRCGGSVEMIQGFRKGTLDGTLRPFGRGMGTDRAGAAWRRWNAACRPTQEDRRVLDGIFYILRTGAPWRDLPERYGPYTSVYNRFNRWAKAGVWGRVFAALARGSPTSLRLIDSSIVRAHQHSAGAKKGAAKRSGGHAAG